MEKKQKENNEKKKNHIVIGLMCNLRTMSWFEIGIFLLKILCIIVVAWLLHFFVFEMWKMDAVGK